MRDLFSSLARPEEGSQCPGRCYHALAALMCEKVLDDKPCPQPSMRCCVLAGGQQAPAPATVAPPTPAALTATKSATTKREVPTTPATTTTPAPTTTPTTRAPSPETTTATSPTLIEKMDTDETELVDGLPRPQPYGAQQGTTICPGVCVAKRLAAYCEAALDLPGVCAADQRCCV
ncbi:protein masquerade-like, partial [Pollicipes pollicipes]|uniref:protein masquerade-like n=1 Tax=Pollicipes pollicipes TaxID=41117 RepID=UPI0018859DFC